ncbi:hypothetical protein ACHAXA_011892 [Cyclostephanos tholiformis]|uniref:Uncharacterized protein n=1 Tax=Cyclostephanos tholiformis TaxID=382380 RepID=A0ABD3SC35_9STRA
MKITLLNSASVALVFGSGAYAQDGPSTPFLRGLNQQYNDGSPTNIGVYKNCVKVVPDYEEDAADIDAPAGSMTA